MIKTIHSNLSIFDIKEKCFSSYESKTKKKRRKKLEKASFFAGHNAFASCSLFIYKPLASSIKAFHCNETVSINCAGSFSGYRISYAIPPL